MRLFLLGLGWLIVVWTLVLELGANPARLADADRVASWLSWAAALCIVLGLMDVEVIAAGRALRDFLRRHWMVLVPQTLACLTAAYPAQWLARWAQIPWLIAVGPRTTAVLIALTVATIPLLVLTDLLDQWTAARARSAHLPGDVGK